MKLDLVRIPPLTSSFLSNEKDTEIILRQLFIENQPYSNDLKKLLVINTKDCLTNKNNQIYKDKIKDIGIKELLDNNYVNLTPNIKFGEHEEVKTYLILTYNNFFPNSTNHKYRDCLITFDIICHTDYLQLDDFALRPLKIAGIIDGILNEAKLSGIGLINFVNCKELLLTNELSGYTLTYRTVRGYDDHLPPEEEE